MEEVVISCSSQEFCVWQLRSGSILQSFKNNSSSTFTRCGYDYILSPQSNKAHLHAYTWRKEQVQWKAPIPEKLQTIQCSNDGRYCCGGGASGICYLWDVPSGKLLSQWQAHFNHVLAVQFFGAYGDMIITGGKDSIIHCWTIKSVLNQDKTQLHPFRSWSGHSLPVTSLDCKSSRVLSGSLDHTAKIWTVSSNDAISSVMFPTAISYCIFNQSESSIYAGSNDGKIYAVNLLSQNPSEINTQFSGHTKAICSMSCSMDDQILVTSSLDDSVKIWDTKSCQLLRNFAHHKGTVHCLYVCLIPRCLLDDDLSKQGQQTIAMFKKYPSNGHFTLTGSCCPVPPVVEDENDSQSEIFKVESEDRSSQEELILMQSKLDEALIKAHRWQQVGKQLYALQLEKF